MKNLLAIIALLVCLTNSVYAQNYFIDESDVDSSFMAFKIQLGKALNTHDTTALFAMLHYTIAESPEGCGLNGSKECFIEQMGFRNADGGETFWKQETQLFRMGFTKQEYLSGETGKTAYIFTAPSFKTQGINNNTNLLVIGENINIREKPSFNGKILAKVSYKKYKFNNPQIKPTRATKLYNGGIHWVELALSKSMVGYVAQSFTSLALDRELSCKKIAGEWKITAYKKTMQFYGADNTKEEPEPDEY